MPVPALVFGAFPPGDDVQRPGADLLVAARTAVLLERVGRLDQANLPARRRAGDDLGRDGALVVIVRALGRVAGAVAARAQCTAVTVWPPSITMVAPVT